MKNWIALSLVVVFAIALVAVRPGYSDDAAKKGKASTAKKAPAKSVDGNAKPKEKTKPAKPIVKKAPKGRLPNYYGQVGISKQQRETIYGIQDKYAPQIADLKKQMAALVAKRNDEIQAVLTEEQRAELVKARDAAKKKALERIKKAAAQRAKEKTAKTTKSN